MLNFTVGPVQSNDIVTEIGGEQVPYFRTDEFSKVMFENEGLIKKFVNSAEEDRVVFITGSGTASMEATVINTLDSRDKVLVINGGSFGQRFVDLCKIHDIEYTEIKIQTGKAIDRDSLEKYSDSGYTALLVNIHETSTGVHYDLDLLSEFCKENNLFFIVDAISSFLADEIDFSKNNIDVMITGSQKALACPPGVSIIVLSKKALERIEKIDSKCMYLNLKLALKNAERGQTPFTPAVGILRQINGRLRQIDENGGVKSEVDRVKHLAEDFRSKIKDLPFEICSESMSNAVTPIHPTTASANDIFLILKNEYNIWICPNGGELKDKIFRVGHIGNLTIDDNDTLISAFKSLQTRGII